MKIQTQTNYLLRPCLAMALALAIGSPIQLQSAEHAEGKGMMMDSKMMDKCQEMLWRMGVVGEIHSPTEREGV